MTLLFLVIPALNSVEYTDHMPKNILDFKMWKLKWYKSLLLRSNLHESLLRKHVVLDDLYLTASNPGAPWMY